MSSDRLCELCDVCDKPIPKYFLGKRCSMECRKMADSWRTGNARATYREKHRETIRAKGREHYAKHPEKYREKNRKAYAGKDSEPGCHTG